MKLVAYAMEWHLTTSDAFRKMLVEPLSGEIEVELRAWDGDVLPEPLDPDRPTIFCMLPPPPGTEGRLVWLPMWDQARGFDQAWWDQLPRGMRVVAFSEEVDRRARIAGLETLRLRYFLDPEELSPARWDHGTVVFSWNRTGLVSPRFLERLCRALDAQELLFLDQIDPRIPETAHYRLNGNVGGARVTQLDLTSRDLFIAATERANVHLAPRVAEGVGMTFLEAMARGCCVVAYDAPTMSEYIESPRNGVLLHNRRLSRPAPFALSDRQPWRRLARLHVAELGAQARSDHAAGHAAWLASLTRYRDFILSA